MAAYYIERWLTRRCYATGAFGCQIAVDVVVMLRRMAQMVTVVGIATIIVMSMKSRVHYARPLLRVTPHTAFEYGIVD